MKKIDKKLLGLVAVFFLMFGFFTISVFLENPPVQIRATRTPQADLAQSLILAFPLSLQVGKGSRIDCIARDSSGGAIANTTCIVNTTCGALSPESAQTNANGISTFTLTSDSACTAQLNATIGDTNVQQTVSVQFTP